MRAVQDEKQTEMILRKTGKFTGEKKFMFSFRISVPIYNSGQ